MIPKKELKPCVIMSPNSSSMSNDPEGGGVGSEKPGSGSGGPVDGKEGIKKSF